MANEFKIKNGLIVDQGGAQITGSLDISGSIVINGGSVSAITGSLLTNASFSNPNLTFTRGDATAFNVDISSLTSTSASYALTASYALNGGSSGAGFPYSGSAVITGSLIVSGSGITVQGPLYATSSWATNSITSSYSLTSNSASYSAYSVTSSYASSIGPLNQNVTITGNLTVIGTASFTSVTGSSLLIGANVITLNTDYPAFRFGGISVIDSGSFGNSSTGSLFWDSLNNRWIYSNPSGSSYDGGMLISGPRNTTGLGNESGMDANFVAVGQGADHIRPGSIYNSGSITIITGSLTVTEYITGSLYGTASWANNAVTASYISGIYAFNYTASYALSNTWTVNHNLGTKTVLIQAYDSSDNQIVPKNITLTNANTATVTFNTPETGYAIASVGGALNFATASVANIALSANAVSTLNQNVIITGSLSLGSNLSINSGSLTITTGSITMPNRPAFRVTGAGGGKVAVTTLSGSYLSVDYQQGSGWDNSTGTFTAPIAGLYQVNVTVRTNSNSLGTISQLIVYKNNTGGVTGTPQIMIEFGANTTMNHTGGSTICKLVPGDTLKMVLAVGEISFDGNDNFSVAYIG